jgi:hypothetical protein
MSTTTVGGAARLSYPGATSRGEQLAIGKAKLKSSWETIFEKYGKDFEGVADEIDTLTMEIVVDNGHLRGMGELDKHTLLWDSILDTGEDGDEAEETSEDEDWIEKRVEFWESPKKKVRRNSNCPDMMVRLFSENPAGKKEGDDDEKRQEILDVSFERPDVEHPKPKSPPLQPTDISTHPPSRSLTATLTHSNFNFPTPIVAQTLRKRKYKQPAATPSIVDEIDEIDELSQPRPENLAITTPIRLLSFKSQSATSRNSTSASPFTPLRNVKRLVLPADEEFSEDELQSADAYVCYTPSRLLPTSKKKMTMSKGIIRPSVHREEEEEEREKKMEKEKKKREVGAISKGSPRTPSIIGEKSKENETVENETVENETVENETVENETVENETVENETVENETVENETVENETVENEEQQKDEETDNCVQENRGSEDLESPPIRISSSSPERLTDIWAGPTAEEDPFFNPLWDDEHPDGTPLNFPESLPKDLMYLWTPTSGPPIGFKAPLGAASSQSTSIARKIRAARPSLAKTPKVLRNSPKKGASPGWTSPPRSLTTDKSLLRYLDDSDDSDSDWYSNKSVGINKVEDKENVQLNREVRRLTVGELRIPKKMCTGKGQCDKVFCPDCLGLNDEEETEGNGML